MFKYDMANYGLDMLAGYAADEVTNAKPKANPAYATARKAEPPRRPRWPRPRPGWRNCWLTPRSRQPPRTAC